MTFVSSVFWLRSADDSGSRWDFVWMCWSVVRQEDVVICLSAFLIRSVCIYMVAGVWPKEGLDLDNSLWYLAGRVQPPYFWGCVTANDGGCILFFPGSSSTLVLLSGLKSWSWTVLVEPAPLASFCSVFSMFSVFFHILKQYRAGFAITSRNLKNLLVSVFLLECHHWSDCDVFGCLQMLLALDLLCDVSLLLWAVFLSFVTSARWSTMLCVVGGTSDSGVGARTISMPSSSKCCRRLSAQQLGVSSMASVMDLLEACSSVVVGVSLVESAFQQLFLLHLSIEVWIFVLSPFLRCYDVCWAFESKSCHCLGMYSISVGNDIMLFDIFLSSFCIGLSSIFLMSSSGDVRGGS